MGELPPAIKAMTISEIKTTLASLVNRVSRNETRVLVEEDGVSVAAIISADDLSRFVQLEREREERFAVIDRIREAFADVPLDKLEREAARSVAAARQRRRERATDTTPRSA